MKKFFGFFAITMLFLAVSCRDGQTDASTENAVDSTAVETPAPAADAAPATADTSAVKGQ